jgi:hypothetical protein
MLPGISSEDCLFADLGIDPGRNGCQSFEATSFLIYRRRFDPSVPLILWQIGVVGDPGHRTECNLSGLGILVEFLIQHYDPAHEVVVYHASQYVGIGPTVQRLPLERVPDAHVTVSSTLLVPAKGMAVPDPAMVDRLKIPPDLLQWRSTGP